MELIQFLAALASFHQDDLKKRMNRIMAVEWSGVEWNGCLGKMKDHPVHTIPNPHLTKMDVLQKTCVQIILAAKYLVQHSRTSIATTFAFSSVFILPLFELELGTWHWPSNNGDPPPPLNDDNQ